MLPLILAGASIGLSAYKAAQQKKQARIAAADAGSRPVLKVPTALQESANLSKSVADNSLLPAQGYYENQIGASTARANQAVQSTGGSASDVIAGITQNDANARGQMNELAAQGAENQQRNKQAYTGVLSDVANQQNEMFDYNQNQPYQTNMLKSQALKDASFRNLNNAINTGIDAAGNQIQGNQMDKLYGTNYYGMNGVKKVKMPVQQNTRNSPMVSTNPMFNNSNLGLGGI